MPRILTLLVLLAGWASPCAALAHERLVRSTPAAGDTLDAAPTVLRLTFSSRVQLAFSGVDLLGPDRRAVALGPLRTDPDSVSILIADILVPLRSGTYVVEWRTGGADGHPVRGRFEFVVASAAAPAAANRADSPAAFAADSAAHDPRDGHGADSIPPMGESDTSIDSPLQVAVRWLAFASILGVIGVAIFRRVVLPAATRAGFPELVAGAEYGARRLGLLLASLLFVAIAARLVAQWTALGGPGGDAPLGRILTTTEWGWGWILQLAGAAMSMAGFLAGARTNAARALVWAAVVALCVSPALSGHAAAAGELAPLTIAADALHVLGAGAWVGTLFVLVLAGLSAALALPVSDRGPATTLLVNRFSPIALGAATLLAASGVLSASVHLGSPGALVGSAYGRTLLVKLALVAFVVALGAFHWRRARHALGSEGSARRLRATAAIELVLAAVVLFVTAMLVATPPPAG